MSKPVRYTCGAYHSPKHAPGCTPAYRAEEGCWCFLWERRLTAREWRAARRAVVRIRDSRWWTGEPVPRPVVSWRGLL